MSEPVLTSKEDLARLASDMAKMVQVNERLERDLKVARSERDQARAAAAKATAEVDRLRKALPAEKVQDELKGLRAAMGEAHRKISVLEKDLAGARDEAEANRKEHQKALRKFENVQGTFDTLQIARDEAQRLQAKAVEDLQQSVESYQKLQADYDALKAELARRDREAKAAKPQKAPEPAKA